MPALNEARAAVASWTPAPIPRAAARGIGRLNLVPVLVRAEGPTGQLGVTAERSWREMPDIEDANASRIAIRRWKDSNEGLREYAALGNPRCAVLEIALRATNGRLTVDGECVHDGPVPTGHAVLTAAGLAANVQFRGPCDVLHLFVPAVRLAAIAGNVSQAAEESAQPWIAATDPVIERLAWLLLKGGPREVQASDLYLDGIALAIVSRLLECSRAGEEGSARGLVKWRLRRVQSFIEEQLSERVSLADLARAAGLSRMHFAAQFRAATGMRPHEYLVRRRIQRAQEILLTTSLPLVEVALSVGFQTQAHFTTVFRRFLGETPGRWREAQRLA